VETDASDIGYGGILKQRIHDKEQLVRYHSGTGPVHNKNILLLKKKFYLFYYVFPNFKMIYLTKNSCYESIANLQKMLYKRMPKI